MEPVTHLLTGACLARTGLNRRAAYATGAMAIAAEFPDVDTVWSLRGPVSGFEHHRGITHTFLGVPFEAAFLLLAFYAFHRAWGRRRRSAPSAAAQPPAPVRWGILYLLLVLALLSHLLLDFTNNYGIRPFFPFHDRWYAGSIVFIFDPLMFLLLVAGLLLPTLFGLIGQEVGARRSRFRGRGWARAALVSVLLLWSLRWVEHDRAIRLAQNETLRTPGDASGSAQVPGSSADPTAQLNATTFSERSRPLLSAERSLASPDPLSVFRWYTVSDFGPAYRLGLADSRLGTLTPGTIFVKPQPLPMLLAAERSALGRAYLDWSPLPVLTVSQDVAGEVEQGARDVQGDTAITFADPRFMGDVPLLGSRDRPPLTGVVVLSPTGDVLAEGMDGRFGHER